MDALSFLANPVPSLLGEGSLVGLFDDSARRHPENIAVDHDGAQITYDALSASASRFAGHLTQRGIGKGDRVAILMRKSLGLYASIIGVLRTGASYVPLDPEYPADRIAFVLDDSRAKCIVTAAEFRGMLSGKTPAICIDDDEAAIRGHEPLFRASPAAPDDEAYVIYTSGSTGRPKGVMVSHANARHLVIAEQTMYRVQKNDRVLQGFSIAFDASIEEIWVTFHAAATLVVGTERIMRGGPETREMLSARHITVLSCVPSFLTMFEDSVPSVRMLIVGGEACREQHVAAWFSPGRVIYNTYGPTEATVVATISRMHPGKAVTIGRPIPNYTCSIMNAAQELLPRGESGELVLGGAGVTKGYVGRDDLTRERYIENRHTAVTGDTSPRLYRTGDRARINEQGEIEFLGRTDSQIKIRGFRIEVSEIESVLVEVTGARNAVVVARREKENHFLCGYVESDTAFDERSAIARLREKLPAYMVPASIDALAEFPRLPSGKIDTGRLPARTISPAKTDLNDPVKNHIYHLWCELCGTTAIGENDDFFTALGGHSLLAARFVSRMRTDARFSRLSMRDLYDHPSIASLAGLLANAAPESARQRAFRPIPQWRHTISGIAQALMLFIVIGFYSLQWATPFVVYSYFHAYEYEQLYSVIAAVAALCLVYPTMLIIAVLLKWIVLGRVREGDHPLWGAYYLRWTFVHHMLGCLPLQFLSGTPLMNAYLRALGAHIGARTHIDSDLVGGLDMISVGADTVINADANISCHAVENGLLKIRSIRIGNDVCIGARAVVAQDTVIGSNVLVDELTAIAPGMRLSDDTRWGGSPAACIGGRASAGAPSAVPPVRNALVTMFFAACFFILPTLGLLPVFPGVMLMYNIDYASENYFYLIVAPLVGASFVLFSAIMIVAVKWLVLGKLREGSYPLRSVFYVRKWLFDKFMEISLGTLGTLYATLAVLPWYRALGVSLGKRAEVSTASFILPDLLEIGQESFIADGVGLGAARIEAGRIILKRTKLGSRTFIGNSAFIPNGTVIDDNCLIGCQTIPRDASVPSGTAWVGHPAMYLPRRASGTGFAEETTYTPSIKLYRRRLAIELLRIILPSTAFIVFTSLLLSLFIIIEDHVPMWQALLAFPLIYCVLGTAAIAVTALLKRIVIGRYERGEHPLWSTFVWKTEFMTGFIENFTNPVFASHLRGTVFLPWYFRLLGMKIGKRAAMHTMDITEFDLVTLGDDVALNDDCTIQTHLFEDRVMKLGTIRIGSRVSVGSDTLVLYDTELEDDVSVGDLSLVMKGEHLYARESWAGSPVTPTVRPGEKQV
ncbi:MAG: Pls/PosA family non-ribosomal peptide synthetase [Spirochaetota bacterium]